MQGYCALWFICSNGSTYGGIDSLPCGYLLPLYSLDTTFLPPPFHQLWPLSDFLTKTPRYSCRNLTWGGRGGCAIIRKQILSNLRNRMKPQGWEPGRISQMGRSGTVFWGKNSLFRWVLVNIYSYTLQLNQLLRPRSWCVIKEFQKNTTLHDKNTKQNPSLPSASLNTLPNLSFPSFSI